MQNGDFNFQFNFPKINFFAPINQGESGVVWQRKGNFPLSFKQELSKSREGMQQTAHMFNLLIFPSISPVFVWFNGLFFDVFISFVQF